MYTTTLCEPDECLLGIAGDVLPSFQLLVSAYVTFKFNMAPGWLRYGCGTWENPPYDRSSGGVLWNDQNTDTKGLLMEGNILVLTTGPADLSYFNVRRV